LPSEKYIPPAQVICSACTMPWTLFILSQYRAKPTANKAIDVLKNPTMSVLEILKPATQHWVQARNNHC